MRSTAVFLVANVLIGACGLQAQENTYPLKIGEVQLDVHVAATPKARAAVIRDHARLAEGQGVLVCYPRERFQHLCSALASDYTEVESTKVEVAKVDYTVAFLDKDGKILEVQNLLRGDAHGITSKKEAPHVLIVPRAWAEKHPLKEDDTLAIGDIVKKVKVEDPPQIMINTHTISLELSSTNDERSRGLMFRTRMSEEDGMLFIYPREGRRSFWMKNTNLPLTLAYIKSDGTISSIHDLEPHNEKSVPSQEAVQYVLEMNRGWFDRHKVQAGDKIALPVSILNIRAE